MKQIIWKPCYDLLQARETLIDAMFVAVPECGTTEANVCISKTLAKKLLECVENEISLEKNGVPQYCHLYSEYPL